MPPWREGGGKTAPCAAGRVAARNTLQPLPVGQCCWAERGTSGNTVHKGAPHGVRSKLEVDHDRHVVAEAGAAPILIVADGQLADLGK